MLCERQGQDGLWPRRTVRPFKGKSEPAATSRHPVFGGADLFYESLNRGAPAHQPSIHSRKAPSRATNCGKAHLKANFRRTIGDLRTS
jgi:hypothetical protein